MDNNSINANRMALKDQEEEREKRFKMMREQNAKDGFIIPVLEPAYKARLVARLDELRMTGENPFELDRISKILFPSKPAVSMAKPSTLF